MNERTRKKALATLDGMAEIIRAERMVRGKYASGVDAPDRKTATCAGRRYCLLGSAWQAHGAKINLKPYGGPDSYIFEGVLEDDRSEYLARRPALRAVYDALNKAAERKIARHPDLPNSKNEEDGVEFEEFLSPAEGLFETSVLGRDDLLKLVAAARREIVKA